MTEDPLSPQPNSSDQTEPQPEHPSVSVLRNRNFLLLWLAQALSQTAQNAIWYGLVVVVEEVSRSGTQLGLAVISTIVPPIVLGLTAGVVVDRVNKKAVLVVTNLLRAIAVLGYLLYSVSLVYVYLINLLLVAISQFFAPAEAATIPLVVPKKQLISATSLFSLTFTAAQLAGLVVMGPPLIKLLGPTGLFVGSALAFAVSAALVSFLPNDKAPVAGLSGLEGRRLVKEVWSELWESWVFAHSDRQIWAAMVHLTLASGLLLMMSMLVPRYVVSVLEIRADDAAFVFAPAGLGMLLGTLSMARLAERFKKTNLVSAGLLGMGISLFVLAGLGRVGGPLGSFVLRGIGLVAPSGVGLIPEVMVVVTLMGFTYALVSVPSQTIVMEQAPAESRGRIFAAQMTLGNVAAVVPLVFLGGMADLFGVSVSLALIGACIFYAGVQNVRSWRAYPPDARASLL